MTFQILTRHFAIIGLTAIAMALIIADAKHQTQLIQIIIGVIASMGAADKILDATGVTGPKATPAAPTPTPTPTPPPPTPPQVIITGAPVQQIPSSSASS